MQIMKYIKAGSAYAIPNYQSEYLPTLCKIFIWISLGDELTAVLYYTGNSGAEDNYISVVYHYLFSYRCTN
jgi:hypothetical protein